MPTSYCKLDPSSTLESRSRSLAHVLYNPLRQCRCQLHEPLDTTSIRGAECSCRSLSKARVHDHRIPLGAAEKILDVDVVGKALRRLAKER